MSDVAVAPEQLSLDLTSDIEPRLCLAVWGHFPAIPVKRYTPRVLPKPKLPPDTERSDIDRKSDNAARMDAIRAERRRDGKCVDCRGDNDTTRVRCSACLEKARGNMRRLREDKWGRVTSK